MRRIRRLALRNFRSYPAAEFSFDASDAIILTGPNGAGKTNLLEALSYLGPGRGMRRARAADVLTSSMEANDGWGIGAELEVTHPDGPDTLRLRTEIQGPSFTKRKLWVDGIVQRSATAALEHLAFVWLTPQQDRLFLDGPGERRRFLDRMTMAYLPDHATTALAYEHAMKQRVAVLMSGRADPSLLSILEGQIAEHAVALADGRRRTATLLAAGYESIISGRFPSAILSFSGFLEEKLAVEPASAVEEEFAGRLAALRAVDREAGRATLGPHRSDLLVTHGEKEQPAKLCSTGEQKALLIGLVLAQAAGVQARDGASLILLLDEIAAHLDADRRQNLADILAELACQSFMTGTDQALFSPWERSAQFVHIPAAKSSINN